jgi:mannose-6-phosphate isomerase-like protein (cupin superfamily)
MEEIIEMLQARTLVKEGAHSLVANLSDEIISGKMRGWVCGHFYPKASIFHRNDIEICVKSLPIGKKESPHHHLCSFEFLLVLSGKVEYKIDGINHVLTPGMFYMLHPGSEEYIVEVFEETTIIAVRLPSIPNNKVLNQST